MRSKTLILLVAVCVCAAGPGVRGEMLRFDSIRAGRKQFGLVTGFGGNHRIPSTAKDRGSFDMIKARYGRFASRKTELAVDLAYGLANTSSQNQSLMTTFGLRHYFSYRGSTALAFDVGVGFTHFQEKMLSLGTNTNFTEFVGLTFQHAIGRKSALTVEYRFSHTSNAGRKLPNIGVNSSVLGVGVSWLR